MNPFYCLIDTPEAITPELCVLAARTEQAALREMEELVQAWPRFERLELYQGNARLRSFTADALRPPSPDMAWSQAA